MFTGWKTVPFQNPSDTTRETSADRSRPPAKGPQRVVSRGRKVVCLGLAGIFFVISGLGVLLPGLPATPFLLLTSYFLVRSSPRLNAALLRSRLFGPILVDWQVHGGVRRHVKFKSIVAVILAVALTIYLSGASRGPTVAVASLAAVGVIVILRLPAAADPVNPSGESSQRRAIR